MIRLLGVGEELSPRAISDYDKCFTDEYWLSSRELAPTAKVPRGKRLASPQGKQFMKTLLRQNGGILRTGNPTPVEPGTVSANHFSPGSIVKVISEVVTMHITPDMRSNWPYYLMRRAHGSFEVDKYEDGLFSSYLRWADWYVTAPNAEESLSMFPLRIDHGSSRGSGPYNDAASSVRVTGVWSGSGVPEIELDATAIYPRCGYNRTAEATVFPSAIEPEPNIPITRRNV